MTRTLRHETSSTRRRSSEIRRSDQQIEGINWWLYFAVDSQYLGEFFGKRRRRKNRFSILLESSNKIRYFRAIQGHSGEKNVDPLLQDNFLLPVNSPSTSTTSGTPARCIPSFKVD